MPPLPQYLRRVIRIRAEDSPNVRLAQIQSARGEKPTGEVILPGVISWEEYCYRRQTWDKRRQCVGLDGWFYEGREVLLYPPAWMETSATAHLNIMHSRRVAKGMGVDVAEGGDKSVWAVGDEYGLIELYSERTPDTTAIVKRTIRLIEKYQLRPDRVFIDRGGGKAHGDRLRELGFPVKLLGFGESIGEPPKLGRRPIKGKVSEYEEKRSFRMRRDQMAWQLREWLDPSRVGGSWAISPTEEELRRQMSLIPLTEDRFGKFVLLPKSRPRKGLVFPGEDPEPDAETLTGIIGHSPDEFDAVMLCLHAVIGKHHKTQAGALRPPRPELR